MQKNWGRDPARRTGPEYEHPKIRAMLQSARIDIEFDAVDGTDDRPCEFDRRAGSSIVLALSGLRRALQFIELDLREAGELAVRKRVEIGSQFVRIAAVLDLSL